MRDTFKFKVCDLATVKLTEPGLAILENDIRGKAVLKKQPDIRQTRTLTIGFKSLMDIYWKYLEPTASFEENEIEITLAPDPGSGACDDVEPEKVRKI